MDKEVIYLRGKPVYVTFVDFEERRIFDGIRHQDGLMTAYRWWFNRHKKKKLPEKPKIKPPKKEPPSLFELKLRSALCDIDGNGSGRNECLKEEPHLFYYPPLEQPITIPGTSIKTRHGVDFRLERWAGKENYKRINLAMIDQGVIGLTRSGTWVFFQLPVGGANPIIREATPQEIEGLERLPDGWEEQLAVESFGE